MQLKHYFEKGFGEKSDFSNTIITPKLVRTTLDRYFELGGDYQSWAESLHCL